MQPNDRHVPAQGGAAQEEGRKSSTKEELMLPCSDAPPVQCSVVSSSLPDPDKCHNYAEQDVSSSGAEEQVRRGQECAMELCVMSASPTLLYIKHGALYPVERSLDYQFPFC